MTDLKTLYKHFSIIPLKGKAPHWNGWQSHIDKKADFSLLENHKDNFGIVCGFDNLEVIDVDNHCLDAKKLIEYIHDNYDLTGFLIIKTGGNGYHIYYKCKVIEGSKKLAQRKIIENDVIGMLNKYKNDFVRSPCICSFEELIREWININK